MPFLRLPVLVLVPLLPTILASCAGGDTQAESSAGSPPASSGDSPTEGLSVRGLFGYYDLGSYDIMGEVVNESGAEVYDVVIELELLDASGKLLATERAAPWRSRVEAGGTVPFHDTHYSAPQGIAAVRGRVTSSSASSGLVHQPLEITGVATRTDASGVIVTGRVRNPGPALLTGAKLVVSFRDAQGRVKGVFFEYPVSGGWVPGRTVDFTLETLDRSLQGHSVTVQSDATAGPQR